MRIVALCLWLAAATLFGADFKTGLDAYNRGDFATALREWQPIAEAGDPHAEYNLGLLYARGEGVAQDYAKAAEWYRKAAAQDVPAAQYNLGVMYANGQGVKADPAEASKWFLKAAEKGVTDAASGLGHIYYEEGAFQNYAEAEKWYRKAADAGVASAAFSLGVMYDIGQGVTRNYEEALKWYHKAADAGYAHALANIGILYYNGQGVKRDVKEAYVWFLRAQKLGDPRAGELANSCTNKLSPGDLKKAQAMVDEWHPSAKPAPVENASLFRPQPQPAVGEASRVAVARGEPSPAGAAPGATPATAPAAANPAGSVALPPAAAPPAAVSPSVAPPATTNITQVRNQWPEVERVVAVGDIHGDYEQFIEVLRSAGLIDQNANWAGGRAHLVQTGDVVDRGPNSRAVMDLLMKLERQAASAGGAVHSLIGNHEAMDVYGDLRFVSPSEFADYLPGGPAERPRSMTEGAVTEQASLAPAGSAPQPAKVPGFAEHRAAFGPNGVYGRWVRGHNAAIKIGRTLFVHAGLGPKYADWTLDQLDNQVRAELNDLTRLHGGVVTDEQGPLWFAGQADGNDRQLVDRLLQNFDVDRIVIGHTYANGAITPRFDGKVVMIDIGLPRIYDNIGQLGCLEIDNGKPYALHRGQKLELPKDENGPDMLRYLKQAAALDPAPSRLAERVAKLEK